MRSPYHNPPRPDLSGKAPLDNPVFTGAVTLPNGSVGTPGTHFDSAGSGFYQPAAGSVGVAIGGVGCCFFGTASSGGPAVGLGAAPQTEILEVGGAIRVCSSSRGFGTGPEGALVDMTSTSVRIGYVAGATGNPNKPIDFQSGGAQLARMWPSGGMVLGTTGTGNNALLASHTNATNYAAYFQATASNFSAAVYGAATTRTASSDFSFFDAYAAGTRLFRLRGDGNGYAAGAWTGGGADYAELFESSDGTALAAGTTVVPDGAKVRASTAGDSATEILGVVRPKSWGTGCAVLGNSAWNHWAGQYQTDAFGCYLTDPVAMISWQEQQAGADGETQTVHRNYWADQLPEGLTPPADGTSSIQPRQRPNPSYDPSQAYKPRIERPEWQVIGLLGQVPILKGQPTGDRWLKLKNIDSQTELWLVR